eukprot:SM000436S15711  [mRNA]  locus=s436:19710:27179:- [translate_table: standard]
MRTAAVALLLCALVASAAAAYTPPPKPPGPSSLVAVGSGGGGGGGGWRSLGAGPAELCLARTLPTGQTFRWRQTGDVQFTGVIGSRLVSLRQLPDDVLYKLHSPAAVSKKARHAADVEELEDGDDGGGATVLRDYFNMGVSLSTLWKGFAAADARFAELAPHLAGARMLRQARLCMVERLAKFGSYLGTLDGVDFHQFPSIEQLSLLKEDDLRAEGFGYRAKYIVGAANALTERPGGGEAWLRGLRAASSPAEVVTELCTLPGVGPKVAACVALFSLNQHRLVPVDTHVWKIAIKYYTPELVGKTLTPRVHVAVANAFFEVVSSSIICHLKYIYSYTRINFLIAVPDASIQYQ